jgi:hypothetical protein
MMFENQFHETDDPQVFAALLQQRAVGSQSVSSLPWQIQDLSLISALPGACLAFPEPEDTILRTFVSLTGHNIYCGLAATNWETACMMGCPGLL